MTFADKIDEWIKEAETRPGSALMILKLIAGRLRDLTERNEELMAENIALQNGTRVEEYQKRIVHLEYQLALLKKRIASGEILTGDLEAGQEAAPQLLRLLVYNASGRIFKFDIPGGNTPAIIGRILGEMSVAGEQPRLLALPEQEDVLLLFTSGRVNTLSVSDIPLADTGRARFWLDAPLPDEPHAGELLAALLPLSRLPISEYILQISRRGSVKKTLASMSESVLSNHYLGRGTTQKADQAFDALLCNRKDRVALVSSQGKLVVLNVDDLSYSAEERMRLDATDFIVASILLPAGSSWIGLTQNGKVVERPADGFEASRSGLSRGQALISSNRLEQGTRFNASLAAQPADRVVWLDSEGNLNLSQLSALTGSGSIQTGGTLLSASVLPAMEERKL